MDDITPTSDSVALAPATSDAVQTSTTDIATSGDTTGAVQDIAQQALDQSTGQAAAVIDPIEQALAGIPANDDDLRTITDQSQLQTLTGMRGQLRVLSNAVRELQPLKVYQEYGDPNAVKSRLQIAKLLYSPLLDRHGNPVRDPNTHATRITTKPFVDYIDKVNPGLPEQLLVDLLALETENEQNIKEPLINQVFRYYKLDPARLRDYQNIDAQITRVSGTVTPEELAEIPSEYHAAYRSIPPSIRAAWAGYDEADRTRMLEDYKAKLDSVAREAQQAEKDKAREAREQAEYAAEVANEQERYLDTVRRERTATLIQSLAQQVTFSADPATNKVMIGSLAATMAQLLDPQWRFVVEENVLAPLGLKIDHTFDQALEKFNSNANDSVALQKAGDIGRASTARDDATSAANQLMAKIAIYALAVAKKQGATVVEKAANQAAQLAAATSARPPLGQVQPGNGNGQVILPNGMMPGSREAARYLAQQTGLFGESP